MTGWPVFYLLEQYGETPWRRQEECVWEGEGLQVCGAGKAGTTPGIGVTSGVVRCNARTEAGATEDEHWNW